MARDEIEQIDVEAAVESPAGVRSVLVMLKALVLQLMDLIGDLRATLAARDAELAEFRKAQYGPKSERKRRPQARTKPVASPEEADARHAAGQKKRQANRKAKAELPTEDVPH